MNKLSMRRQYGGVAQLGERTVRIRKVKGSNPSVSTIPKGHHQKVMALWYGGDKGFELCLKATQVAFIDQFKNWSIPLSDFPVPRKGKSDACESRPRFVC